MLCLNIPQNLSVYIFMLVNPSGAFLVLPSLGASSPPFAFWSLSPTRQILYCESYKWGLCKIWLTSYRLNIHLSVYTAGSRGQGLFFCALHRACNLKCCHYQPHYNDNHNAALLQLGGKLASKRWGLNSAWQRKQHWNNQLSFCLQNPKGYLETPVQTRTVYASGM